MYLQISPILGCWGVQLGLAGVVVGGAIAFGSTALAQVVPDNTLGVENSVVTSTDSVDTIAGGATREGNLFHSFRQFSVLDGRTASFANEANIQNIFARVTGGFRSDLDGILAAGGTANLFLLNPNGIVFGRNAQLDIGGSFVASTANAIGFGDQGVFSATDPNAPPLLTVNPSAFLFNPARAAAIENNSKADAGRDPAGSDTTYFGLRVPDNKSLLLVGGDLKADGGGIVAFGGRVDLAAVAGTGTVGLNVNGDNLSLSVPDGLSRADASLTNESWFVVSAGGGGDIAITAKNINMNNSFLDAGILSDFGSVGTQAGDITLNATDSITLANVSQLGNSTSGQGNSGQIKIKAGGTVTFDGRDSSDQFPSGAFTRVNAGATGDSGGIDISAGSLVISNRAQLSSNTESKGNAGNITIEARDQVSLFNSILISEVSEEGGVGNGGDINIKTGTLLLKDGSSLLTDLENQGERAGDIKIEARDAVIVEGRGPSAFSGSLQRGEIVPSQITATVDPISPEADTRGKGGNISILTNSLLVDYGFISVNTFGKGDAGSISIDARQMILSGGGQILASTSGSGNAGNLLVTGADLVELIGISADGFSSGLFAQVNSEASGNGGNLIVETKQLNMREGAEISVSSFGLGAAGNLDVTARDLRLDNSTLEATTTTGDRGNITVRSRSIAMRRGSQIATNASGDASGGNINIDTRLLIAAPIEDNDIIANAVRGRGGNININAEAIFGIQQRSQRTPLSDITATSELGVGGTVQLNSPEVDPSRDVVELPTTPVDASTLVASGCPSGAENRFVVAGRGGLPPAPGDKLSTHALLTDWATLTTPKTQNRATAGQTIPEAANTTTTPLVEATTWQFGSKGEIILTNADPAAPNSFEATPSNCPSS